MNTDSYARPVKMFVMANGDVEIYTPKDITEYAPMYAKRPKGGIIFFATDTVKQAENLIILLCSLNRDGRCYNVNSFPSFQWTNDVTQIPSLTKRFETHYPKAV